MKKLLSLFLSFCSVSAIAQTVSMTVDVSKKGIDVSPTLSGLFLEDINHAIDGGFYAELIRNCSFNEGTQYWGTKGFFSAGVSLSTENTDLVNSKQSNALQAVFTKCDATHQAGIYNTGWWGMHVEKGDTMTVSLLAKRVGAYRGQLVVSVTNNTRSKIYGSAVITDTLTEVWNRYTVKFPLKDMVAQTDNSACFLLKSSGNGTVLMDMVSLFPPTYMGASNGVRRDLGELLAAIHPKFLRFPGGCFVEGGDLANRYQWKKTIGPLENRQSHTNVWNYESLNGFGFHEYLQLAEDLGAEPLFVVNVGISHSDYVAYDKIDEYIQDAVDALEYANGDTTTTYGRMRAQNGHPAPFNLKMIEIGNENNQFDTSYRSQDYSKRFKQFKAAILAKYPATEVIGDVDMWCADNCRQSWYQNNTENCTTDYLDEHYYHNPGWFAQRFSKYDNYDRSQKIFCGEYASTSDCGNGNLSAALGEAIFRMGLENNSDVVRMSCFAPTFRNVNADNNWNYDMIHFNSNSYYCSPSYYTQMLCGANTGEQTVDNTISGSVEKAAADRYVGLGSWLTSAVFDDLQVINTESSASLVNEQMDANAGWTYGKGTWSVSGGSLNQTDAATEGATAIYPTKISTDNYTMTVRAKKNSGNEGFLIILDYKDAQNYTWLNLGGWGNSQNAIEQCVSGAKTTIATKSGSLTTGKWYDIKIEVKGLNVKCYLDGSLLFSATLSGDNQVFGNATYTPLQHALYVKVVNPTSGTASFRLNVKGAQTLSNPVLTVLSSSSPEDENSMSNPRKVYPLSKSATITDGIVSFSLQPYSLNILKLNTAVIDAIQKVKSDVPSVDNRCLQDGIYSIDGVKMNCDEANLPHGYYIVDGKKLVK